MEVAKIHIHLTEADLDVGVRRVMDIVRPPWAADDSWPKLTSKIFTDGITNKLIGYFLPEAPRDVIIVKIYGPKTEDMIDRTAEIETMKFLNTRGMGSKLYGTFDNGIVYEFIPGKTLDPSSCRDPKIFPLVAAEMAKLHSIPLDQVPQPNKSAFWNKLNTFLTLANEILVTNPTIRQKYSGFGLTNLWTSHNVQKLRTLIENAGMPYAFCHNDILLPNIVFDDKNSKVSFIDFEYAFINYGPFDIANHFNEFAGVDNADFSLCPDNIFMATWLEEYLKHWVHSDPASKMDYEIDVAKFQHWVDLCIPLSHLFWIIWTVIQAQNSTIEFDYIKYAEKRFVEFEKKMRVCNGSGTENLNIFS